MAKSKTFQAFTGKKWVELKQSKPGDNTGFKAAEAAGLPIRILWASGSFKVLRNAHALPETKPYAKKKGKAAVAAAKAKPPVVWKDIKPMASASVPPVSKKDKVVLSWAEFLDHMKKVKVQDSKKPVYEDYSIIGAPPSKTVYEDYSIIGA